ncbi:MAG TPA: protein kinase, partial [Kofleriaceae bacterium]
DGRVRVTDFGLARSLFLDDSARGAATTQNALGPRTPQQTPAAGSPLQVDLTATGTVLGTPRYMPPEQLTGPSIDARADQFSFCVALYEALYSTHPLPGATSVSMLEHDEKALPPPEGAKVPSSIARAVMRGLEKERSKRFPTLAALMHELTPPPQRSPARFIGLAAVGALVVTVSTAAVMSRPQHVLPSDPIDNNAVKVLIDEINRKDQEIKDLRKQLGDQAKKSLEDVEQIKRQLDAAQEEVKRLNDEYVAIVKRQAVGKPVPIPIKVDSKQVTAAIQSVYPSVQFCLDDLDSRVNSTQGAPKSRDIGAVVRLSTTPSGKAFDIKASGIDYSPSVRLCIEDALARVAYPQSAETLEIRVDIAWTAGNLSMGGRVVGTREPNVGTNPDF